MRKLLIVVLLFSLLIPQLTQADDTRLKKEINANIAKLSSLLGDSYSNEYTEYRGIQIFKEKKNRLVIAVSIFTVEGLAGGNNYTQFMAVFCALSEASPGHPQRMSLLDVMAVGGKGLREVEFKKIMINKVNDKISITVPTLEYSSTDAFCCPSIKSEAHFIIIPSVGGRLKEITNSIK